MTTTTRVIFRKWKKEGDIIAFFPDIPDTGCCVLSYMHVGQHGAADYQGLLKETIPARPEEYTDLRKELESIGYRLDIHKRK